VTIENDQALGRPRRRPGRHTRQPGTFRPLRRPPCIFKAHGAGSLHGRRESRPRRQRHLAIASGLISQKGALMNLGGAKHGRQAAWSTASPTASGHPAQRQCRHRRRAPRPPPPRASSRSPSSVSRLCQLHPSTAPPQGGQPGRLQPHRHRRPNRGILVINYDFLAIPDQMRIYYPPRRLPRQHQDLRLRRHQTAPAPSTWHTGPGLKQTSLRSS